jgi:COP9 signalosome complex subunit 3
MVDFDFIKVVSSPAQVPASIQLEAYKKMALIQLIIYGEVSPLAQHFRFSI